MKTIEQRFLMIFLVPVYLFLGGVGLASIGYCEDGTKFIYHQKSLKKVKEKNLKVRVAISRFDEKIDIKGSPFNVKDKDEKDIDKALIRIEDSDVDINVDEDDKKEISKAEFLTGLIANALQEAGSFEVVERREINEIIREINFQNSKWVKNEASNTLGNIYDVQYIINGDILRNQDGEKIGKHYYTLALRMYDVNTGAVLSSSAISSPYLKEAVDEAVANLSEQIKEKPWTCRVVGVGDGEIYVNAGFKDGIEEKDVFYVYRVEGKIVDPKTKEVLGFKRRKVAMIEIQEVSEARLSKVKTIEVFDKIKVGDTVSADRIENDTKSEIELWKKIYNNGDFSSDKLSKYSLTTYSSSPEAIMTDFGRAVVKIQAGTVMGSGFIVDAEGHIITNFHIVQDATNVSAKMIEKKQHFANVQVVKTDPQKDIALLKINNANDLPVVVLGDSNRLSVGERVVAIGNPQGLENTISDGLVSGIRETGGVKLIQTSVPVTHGSSGGPLFNMQGEVVGIITAGIEESGNLNFAVPINYVKDELLN